MTDAAELLPLVDGLIASAVAARATLLDLRARLAVLAAQEGLPGGVAPGGGPGVPVGAPGPVTAGPKGVPPTGRSAGVVTATVKPVGVRSGLGWASLWRHPNAYTINVRPAFESFEGYRGRALDGLHVFMQGWQGASPTTWPARCWPTARGGTPGGADEGVLWWLGREGIDAYLTWPLFPDTGLPAGKARFQAVVAGAFDGCHAAVAGRVLATGATVRTIRLGHEANMGDVTTGTGTYPWSIAYAQGDLALYRAAYVHVASLLQGVFPDALLDFNCLRKLTNVATFDDIFPGPPFRIISGEAYGTDDIIATPEGLTRFMTQGTPDYPLGPESWAACAAKRGCLYAVPEWSPTVPPGKTATRDVPAYIAAMFDHFSLHSDNLCYESLFGNDDPSVGLHSLWSPVSCPNCSAEYQRLYRVDAP